MKRVTDLLFATLIIVLLLPLLAVLALAVRVLVGPNVLFRQERPGLNGKIFTLFKFRTMSGETDSMGMLLADSLRLTRFGAWLRRTSMDELPELWNVLRGDMSLVGPRPLLIEYLELYNDRQMRRHEVRPGITGWAQINGRNRLSWEEKFELDVWYVDHQSLVLDLRILLATVWLVFNGQGVTAEGSVTAERFNGNRI